MKKPRNKRKKAVNLIVRVADNIKRYRLENHFTQEQLQEMCGIKVYRYESEKRDMTLTTISILSKYLKVKPYQLLM